MHRNRIRSILTVAAFMALVRLFSEGGQGATWLYLIALPIGYGHLVGALWFGRAKLRATAPARVHGQTWGLFLAISTLIALAAYTWALHVAALAPLVLVPMLLASAWHIVENDLALTRAYLKSLRIGPLAACPSDIALITGICALIGLLALTTPTGGFWSSVWFGQQFPMFSLFSIEELATAVLMYHAVSWLLFFWDRARGMDSTDPAAARCLRRGLLFLHVVPLSVNLVLYLGAPAVYVYVASPTLYLFGSVAHALQTAIGRAAPNARGVA